MGFYIESIDHFEQLWIVNNINSCNSWTWGYHSIGHSLSYDQLQNHYERVWILGNMKQWRSLLKFFCHCRGKTRWRSHEKGGLGRKKGTMNGWLLEKLTMEIESIRWRESITYGFFFIFEDGPCHLLNTKGVKVWRDFKVSHNIKNASKKNGRWSEMCKKYLPQNNESFLFF
jgi:hypothetical protein